MARHDYGRITGSYPARSGTRGRLMGLDWVDRSQIPQGFKEWPRADQFEYLLGASMAQAAVVMSWNPDDMTPSQMACWNATRHDVWNVSFKLGLEDRRSAERERILLNLLDRLPEKYRDPASDALKDPSPPPDGPTETR